jgi:hypothetical protein
MYWHSDTPNRTGIYGAGMALAFGINFNNLHNSWGNMKFNNQADILLDAEIALGHNSFNLRYAIADNPWYYIIKRGDTYYGIANRMLNGTVINGKRGILTNLQLIFKLEKQYSLMILTIYFIKVSLGGPGISQDKDKE